MSALNLTNVKTGIFNDLFMVQNTGYSSIYNIFGSKTDISNLGGMNTTTLSQISSTITGLSTLNSALATKATITSVSNINNTLTSIQNDIDNNSAAIIELSITQQSIINSALPNLTTGLSTLNSTLATKANAADVYDTLYIDETLATKATTTSVNDLTNTVNSTITSISNINITLPSLLSYNEWNTTIYPALSNNLDSRFLTIGSKLLIDQNTTNISNLSNTVNSTITSISNINTTLPSLLSYNEWNTTIYPALSSNLDSRFLTIGSKLLIDQNTTNISNLSNTVNSTITSISNINTTLPSLITNSTLTSNLNNYLTTVNFSSSSLLNTTTINSYLSNITTNSLLVSGNTSILGQLTTSSILNISGTDTTFLYFINNTSMNSRIAHDPAGNIVWRTNMSMNSQIPFRLNNLGFLDISNSNKTNNKMLVLSEYGANDPTLNATNFSGFGINTSTLRYQVPNGWSHKFFAGSSSLFEVSNTSLSVLGNITTTGQTHIMNSTAVGGDVSLTLRNFASGSSSLYLYSNTTVASRIYQDPTGSLNVAVNISGTSFLPLSLYSNGVVNVNSSNGINNKVLVLYDNGASDAPSTATNYSGIGIQSGGALRYQVPTATSTHRFFCGTTQSFFITNGSGASGSDARWKTEVQNITNGLDKVKQLQGKTFIYNGCSGRQMGLIGQEVLPLVPEVVIENDGYYLIAYDRLVALLIESVKELENRVSVLEGA